jgi:hypothetical protein
MTPFIVTILKQGCPTVDIDAHFLEVVQALTEAKAGPLLL